jgi:uncharacterized protein YbjQ (UPF0145 family)
MKKFLLISIALVLFASCAQYKIFNSYFDYSEYDAKGLFITEATSVSFPYTPVGSIVVNVVSGLNRNAVVDGRETGIIGDYKKAILEDGFNHLYKEAMRKKANGVINLQFEHIKNEWVITGMLIKK